MIKKEKGGGRVSARRRGSKSDREVAAGGREEGRKEKGEGCVSAREREERCKEKTEKS